MSEVLPTRSESESERELPRWPIIMGLVVTLVGPLFLSALDRTQGLRFQIIQGVLLGIAVLVAGWVWSTQRRQRVRMVWHPRKAHLIQAVSHGIVYAYWATQNPGVAEQIPLILLQIPFAYCLDIGLAWRRYGTYRFGFAPIPIIGSTNLFLWMTDEWFFVQFIMVAIAYLSREFIVRTAGDTRRHIFNPSAAGLASVSIILLLLGETEWARGQYIASSLGTGVHCFDSILLAGLLVQCVFPVVWTSLGAFTTVLIFDVAFRALGGGTYFLDTTVPVAVFLGMVLLVTDPATSPQTRRGKWLFGVLYGLSVIALHAALWQWGNVPWDPDITYFDKLLAVPVLNLLAPLIDRLATGIIPVMKPMKARTLRLIGLGTWILVYLLGRGSLVDNPGQSPSYWSELCEKDTSACERFFAVWKIRCDHDSPNSECIQTTRRALEVGCEADAEYACSRLAFHLIAQTHDAEAMRTGFDSLVQLCHDGDNPACIAASEVLATSEANPSQKQLHLLRTACHRKFGEGCERLAILLAPGAQKEADQKRVSEYLFIASQEGRPVTNHARSLATRGKVPGKTSVYRARVLLKKACRKRFKKAQTF